MNAFKESILELNNRNRAKYLSKLKHQKNGINRYNCQNQRHRNYQSQNINLKGKISQDRYFNTLQVWRVIAQL